MTREATSGSPVVGVHEFRAGLPTVLRRFRADPDAAEVVVGAYRRPEAVLVPYTRWRQCHPRRRPRPDTPNGPAIRALLAVSPQERLLGLIRADEFFAGARRA